MDINSFFERILDVTLSGTAYGNPQARVNKLFCNL